LCFDFSQAGILFNKKDASLLVLQQDFSIIWFVRDGGRCDVIDFKNKTSPERFFKLVFKP